MKLPGLDCVTWSAPCTVGAMSGPDIDVARS